MKILQISNKIPFLAKDGGALAMFNLMDGFVKEGLEVHVLSMNTSKHFLDPNDFKDKINSNTTFDSVYVNTRIRLLSLIINLIFSSKPYVLQRFISRKFKLAVQKKLDQNEFDIIQIEGLYLCPYIDVIKKHSKGLIAYRSHNIESEIWKNNMKQEKNIMRKMYMKILSGRLVRYEKKVINCYDLLLPISPVDLEFYSDNGNLKPVCLTPFGIDPNKYVFETMTDNQDLSLFYIGSLDWIPNIEGLKWFVHHVWKKLYTRYPGMIFKVAGRNAGMELIKYLKLNQVDFLGEIEDSDTLFLNNSIMIVPLFSGSGMRVKIIEGMAYGKTIISTPKGAEGIECFHSKQILIADDAESFIQLIESLINDKSIVLKIGKEARNLVSNKYNNRIINQNLVKFYEQSLV